VPIWLIGLNVVAVLAVVVINVWYHHLPQSLRDEDRESSWLW
jgi:hypothetical protein